MHNRQVDSGTENDSVGRKLLATTRGTIILYILLYAVKKIYALIACDVRSEGNSVFN